MDVMHWFEMVRAFVECLNFFFAVNTCAIIIDIVKQTLEDITFKVFIMRFFTCFHGNSRYLRPCYHALRHPFGAADRAMLLN